MARGAHTCLPLVLPAGAATYAVADPSLAALLTEEGCTVHPPGGGGAPDVAIGPPFDGAPVAIALVATAREKVDSQRAPAVRRVVDHLRARREVVTARRALADAG